MSHSGLRFRLATLGDAEQVRELVESAFRAEDSRPQWTADMELGSRFTLDIADVVTQIQMARGGILIATDAGGVFVASVSVGMRNDDLARISMLSVDAQHQRGGLGRHVLQYAENYCRRIWGAKKVGLNALATRRMLILWYSRRGYQETGETTPFPYRPGDSVASSPDLYFVEMEKCLDEDV